MRAISSLLIYDSRINDVWILLIHLISGVRGIASLIFGSSEKKIYFPLILKHLKIPKKSSVDILKSLVNRNIVFTFCKSDLILFAQIQCGLIPRRNFSILAIK